MVFELRPTTERIRKALWQSYARNSKMALLTVKTGGGKTYGAIHTFGSIPKFKMPRYLYLRQLKFGNLCSGKHLLATIIK